MKTLKLYIDGVKCQFEGGKMTCLTPTNLQWCRKNRDEIRHYRDLTLKTAQQKLFLERCDSNLLIEVCTSQMIPRRLNFAELYKQYQALHYEKYECYLQPLFIPADCLRFGHLGHGVTVYVVNHEHHSDYLTIAHISPGRVVSYRYELDNETRARIEKFAATDNMTRSATQNDLVLTPAKP
jgi:hypothetical protein